MDAARDDVLQGTFRGAGAALRTVGGPLDDGISRKTRPESHPSRTIGSQDRMRCSRQIRMPVASSG